MSDRKVRAEQALKALLWELPAEFSSFPPWDTEARSEFRVIKQTNVLKVHEALWELQQYFNI